MKFLFPGGEAGKGEMEVLLRFAIEGRKRVKDQLLRIDPTYHNVRFAYSTADGEIRPVATLEEESYPKVYHSSRIAGEEVAET